MVILLGGGMDNNNHISFTFRWEKTLWERFYIKRAFSRWTCLCSWSSLCCFKIPNLLHTRGQHFGIQISTEPKPPAHGRHPRSCRESASGLLPHRASLLAKCNPNNTHPWLISTSKPRKKLGGCALHLGIWDDYRATHVQAQLILNYNNYGNHT